MTVSFCHNCGAALSADASFCGRCGQAVPQLCPDCGTRNDPLESVCTSCGRPLAVTKAGASEVGSPPAPTLDPPAQRQTRKRTGIVVAAALVVIGVVLAAGVAFGVSSGGDDEENDVAVARTLTPATGGSRTSTPGPAASTGTSVPAATVLANIANMFDSSPPPSQGLKTGQEALLAGGPDRTMSRVASDALRKEGLDTNLIPVSVWPVAASNTSLLVFQMDANATNALPKAQQDAQANAVLKVPGMSFVRIARITRIVFFVRNFPQPGERATITVTLAYLTKLASGAQPTQAEFRNEVLFQVAR